MRIGLTLTATAVVVICVAVGIAGYVAYRPSSPPPEPAPLQEQPSIGKFNPVSPPLPAPAAAFNGRDGKPIHLADWRGHWLLVNLWATWCAPCIKEMPSLDRMQAKLGPAIKVVAISEDRGGSKVVEPFLAKLAVPSLTIGLDMPDGVLSGLKIRGLPTSFLIDPQGRIVAKLEGGTEWDTGPTLTKLTEMMGTE